MARRNRMSGRWGCQCIDGERGGRELGVGKRMMMTCHACCSDI